MKFNYDQWQRDLTQLISESLAEFRSKAAEEMETFALDCHPWNGDIGLAFLTRSELKEDPFLSEAAEMAAWKYFDFGAGLACWQPPPTVASGMRPVYEAAGEENRPKVVREFLERCARAMASKPVQDILAQYRLAENFKITIQHPDTAEEFYPPK
jgi:hypothetical protein